MHEQVGGGHIRSFGPAVPVDALRSGERIVSSAVIQTARGPVEIVTVESPAPARARHDDDEDDEHDKRERGTPSFRRERR